MCICVCEATCRWDGGGEAGGDGEEEEKKNEAFNSLTTSVYLEKKPLCHSVILTTYTGANVSPTMTAF